MKSDEISQMRASALPGQPFTKNLLAGMGIQHAFGFKKGHIFAAYHRIAEIKYWTPPNFWVSHIH